MTPLAIAADLLGRGFSVIPLDHPADPFQEGSTNAGKIPVIPWKRFQDVKATSNDLEAWFGNGRQRNVGIVTGAVSGIVVVDGDSEAGLAWMRANLPQTPMRVRTAKGEHWYYRHPGTVIKNAVRIEAGDPAIKIDVRADGGFVVGAYNLHASGVRYEWMGAPPPIDALPVFDPAWLGRVDARPPAPKALPGSIQEGGRNDALFKEGCRLRRLGWGQSEILGALETINQSRCRPPLGAHEVEAAAQSSAKYEPAADTFPLTEAGDAEYFASAFGELVRYDHRRERWLLFGDHRWAPQSDGEVSRLALEAMRARQRAAYAGGQTDKLKWAIKGESRSRLSNMLALAQDLRPIADAGDAWDLDPWLLGCPNGVLDLRTGELRPGEPADRITMSVRPPFDPNAECLLWEQTLDDIFDRDVELLAFTRRAIGYSITGVCHEECFFLNWGGGGNGKGTTMNTVAYMMADYADDLPFSALERHERASVPNDIAKLVGKRFVTASESSEVQLNEARIKSLTGQDPTTARFLHKEWFTFFVMAKFWLATNKKPIVRDDSEGFWRRIHLIPFTRFFKKADLTLKNRLRDEAPGILAWAVRGCLEWQRDGLNPPSSVRTATDAYRHESEPLAKFYEECCVINPAVSVRASELFTRYRAFGGALSLTAFGAEVRKRFAAEEKRHVRYLGLGLAEQRDETLVEGM